MPLQTGAGLPSGGWHRRPAIPAGQAQGHPPNVSWSSEVPKKAAHDTIAIAGVEARPGLCSAIRRASDLSLDGIQ